MTNEKKSTSGGKKEEESPDIDFGIGKLNLGGLFKGLEKLVDLAGELKDAGGEVSAKGGPAGGWKKEGELDLSQLKKGMKGVFGVSIKTMEGGRSVVEPFGNIKKTPQGPKVEEEREPIVDVFDEQDEIKVYAEMPGISEESISLELKGDMLEIKAGSKDRKYHKEVLLPAKLKSENLASSYKNGILEIRIKK